MQKNKFDDGYFWGCGAEGRPFLSSPLLSFTLLSFPLLCLKMSSFFAEMYTFFLEKSAFSKKGHDKARGIAKKRVGGNKTANRWQR